MSPRSLNERWQSRRRTSLARRRFASALALPDVTLLPIRGELLPGYPRAIANPSAANLDLIVSAARAAGVELTAVPSSDEEKALVAIDRGSRGKFLDALRVRATQEPIYLKVPGSSPTFLGEVEGALGDCRELGIFVYRRDPATKFVQGARFAARVAFASREDGRWAIEVNNRVTTCVPEEQQGRAWITVLGRRLETFQPLADITPATSVTFPIDAVYTWVDTEDPDWQRRRERAAASRELTVHADGPSRFTSRDELRFSLRSIAQFAPWIRTIWIVTADQTPSWLRVDPRVRMVSHREIFPDADDLPTFNSHAIEACLHRIDGLSEHFLYLNDDVYFGRPVPPESFFEPSGLPRVCLSKNHIDLGPPTPAEPAVMASAKRNRELLEQETGRTITNKLLHTPHPVRRSVMGEVEGRFGGEFRLTRSARFRSPTDISPIALHAHYALIAGQAARGDLAYGYVDSVWPDFETKLGSWARRREWDALCINDSTATSDVLQQTWSTTRRTLLATYPQPAPWEASS